MVKRDTTCGKASMAQISSGGNHMTKFLVTLLIIIGIFAGIFFTTESAFARHRGYFGIFLPPPPPILVGPPSLWKGYPSYYGTDYYGAPFRSWVPGYWESRWTPYGWRRVWVPGYWNY